MTLLPGIHAEPGSGFVSDGRSTFSFAALQNALPAWDAWFERNGVSRDDCIALPTRTDTRSAAAVLALLARGQSVLLWRQALAIEGGKIVAGTLPPFCRFALVEAENPSGAQEAGIAPDSFRLLEYLHDAGQASAEKSRLVYLATSGTTGKPKIVVFPHDTLLGNARNCLDRLQLNAMDRIIIPVPLAHMYGLGAALLPAVQAGASIHLVPEANLVNYLQAEAEFEPTVAFLTPSFGHLLLKGRKRERPYRLTVLAGDRAGERTFAEYEQRHGCTVNLYGSTELGVIAAGDPQDSFPKRRDTAGKPLPGVRLAAPEDRDLDAHGVGQAFPLRVDHPYGCAGYANADGSPSMPTSLYEDGWYCTQDLGRLDDGGRIQLLGRFDHTVKRDGFLVAFADVESALLHVEGIDRVVVVPGGTTPRGRELVAMCTIVPGAPKDAAAIGRAARQRLPAHAVPDRFIFLDELPLTATAKPDRIALGAMVSTTKEDAVNVSSR